MALSPKTIDFLVENRMNDSREWFRDNKKRYEEDVKAPLYALAQQVGEGLLVVDSEIVTEPRRMLSRINRDLRFTKDMSLYRDHLWFNIMRKHERFEPTPCMYFDIGPRGASFGCGFYSAGPKVMGTMREMILAGSPAFERAKAAAEGQTTFVIAGDTYKREPCPGHEDGAWLNRKNIYFEAAVKDKALLFSDRLAPYLIEELVKLGPVYDFFRLVQEREGT